MVDIPKDIMNSYGIREKSILEIEKSVQNSLMILKNQAEKLWILMNDTVNVKIWRFGMI